MRRRMRSLIAAVVWRETRATVVAVMVVPVQTTVESSLQTAYPEGQEEISGTPAPFSRSSSFAGGGTRPAVVRPGALYCAPTCKPYTACVRPQTATGGSRVAREPLASMAYGRRMNTRRLLLFTALVVSVALVTGSAWQLSRGTRRARSRERARREREELGRWESEGGALPVAGTVVAPADVPEPSPRLETATVLDTQSVPAGGHA
jgi:hypothetical protein